MGGRSRKKSNRESPLGDHGSSVEGGLLFSSPPSTGRKENNGKGIDQDSIPGSGRRSKAQRIRGIAVGYIYPQENVFIDGDGNLVNNITASNPILLADSEKSSIVVSSDEGLVKESQNVEYMYDYTTSSALGENQGYLLIGGRKIYTQDISEEGEDEGLSEEKSCGSSDIDDEVAVDFFERRGGISDNIDVDRFVGQIPYDDIGSEDILDETMNKLGGIDLQEASMEYGMKSPKLFRKCTSNDKKSSTHGYLSLLDDIMRIRDPTTFFGKKKKVARFPQSWTSEGRKSIKARKIQGRKMRHPKEMIAANFRDRMIRRGVDLQKINLKLKKMVLDGTDTHSFPPMHPEDCSQVRRLASIYCFHSDCQGSGMKRFVKVIRTQHTCMPSTSDKIRRQEKIIEAAANKEAAGHSSVSEGKRKPMKVGGSSSYKSSREAKDRMTRKVEFVSSGILNTEIVETGSSTKVGVKAESECGAFEIHTTGFGSKMLSKMGHVEGGGLGKYGQGMTQPIQVSQRPKSLGLGAQLVS